MITPIGSASSSGQSQITDEARQEDPEAVASTSAELQIIPANDEDPEASRYFECDDDELHADTSLAAGTPALLDHVLTHPMTCSLQ
uniref:Uncharacterized protein n=1 Tax=Timema shepardi TaxID=629360 RepID=A0A7R9G171_TIMSH|nr:unnamed protein product [Timema shepardi]